MAINYYLAMDSDSVQSASSECTYQSHLVITRSSQRVSIDTRSQYRNNNKTGVEGESDGKKNRAPTNSILIQIHSVQPILRLKDRQQFADPLGPAGTTSSNGDRVNWKKKNEKMNLVKNQINWSTIADNNMDRESTLVSKNDQMIQSNDDTTTISSLRVRIDTYIDDKSISKGAKTRKRHICRHSSNNVIIFTK